MTETRGATPHSADEAQLANEISAILKREFQPQDDDAAQALEYGVRTLAQQALSRTHLISSDVKSSIEAIVDQLDRTLSEQINEVLHHPDFQRLEGTWRGLYRLVEKTGSDGRVKIRFLNISKNELGRTLHQSRGRNWDRSAIFKRVYEDGYGQLGGEPFSCLVGDFYFDHSAPDVELLYEMAKIASATQSPFIAGASPTLLQLESWHQLPERGNLGRIYNTPEYAGWRSLRWSPEARYIGLTMPRMLARAPYGTESNPIPEFDFDENVGAPDHERYTWTNSAYAMIHNIIRSFGLYGWCSRIKGIEGGSVEALPVHVFATDDGGWELKAPVETVIDSRREAELIESGLIPLVHRRNSDNAVFMSALSLNKPEAYEDQDANVNVNLAARLPYLLACCRFAHYLLYTTRERAGALRQRSDLQRWLEKWLGEYVEDGGAQPSEQTQMRLPLAAAAVTVEEIEDDPGYYWIKLSLAPRHQFDGVKVSIGLVSRLPSTWAS